MFLATFLLMGTVIASGFGTETNRCSIVPLTLPVTSLTSIGEKQSFRGDWDINASVSGIRTKEERLAKIKGQPIVFAGDKNEQSARKRAEPFIMSGHPVYFADIKSEDEALQLARRLKKQYGVPAKFEVTGRAAIPVAAVYRAYQMTEGLFVWVHVVDAPEGFTSEDLISDPVVYRAPKAFARRTVAPSAITKNDAGNYLVDFGRAAFGWVEVNASTEVEGAAGEKLTEKHSVDIIPFCAIRGAKVYAPRSVETAFKRLQFKTELFSRGRCLSFPRELGEIMPMRYLEIQPGAFEPSKANVRMVALEYPYNETESGFSSDNPVLDDIYDLCKYTLRACTFAGMYMDGDRERLPYEADAYVTQLSNYAMSSDYDVSRATCDYLMPYSTWPTEYRQISVLMNWAYWMWSGHDDLIAKHYDKLKNEKLMERFRRAGDGLLETGGEMLRGAYEGAADIADWPPPERHGFEFRKVNAVVNAYYYIGLRQMAEIAAHLGKEADAAAFRARSSQVYESFQKAFFNESSGVYVDGEGAEHASIHANSLAVVAGLVPEDRIQSVGEYLSKQEMKCSVYFAQHFLEALFKTGYGARAVALMTADNDRSWAGMLKSGATLTKESWNESVNANVDWNHTWGAAAINILARCLAGVTPVKPGFEAVRIEPKPAGLSHFNAKVPTGKGPVEIRCERINGKYEYEIKTPAEAEIVISGRVSKVSPGKYVFR